MPRKESAEARTIHGRVFAAQSCTLDPIEHGAHVLEGGPVGDRTCTRWIGRLRPTAHGASRAQAVAQPLNVRTLRAARDELAFQFVESSPELRIGSATGARRVAVGLARDPTLPRLLDGLGRAHGLQTHDLRLEIDADGFMRRDHALPVVQEEFLA